MNRRVIACTASILASSWVSTVAATDVESLLERGVRRTESGKCLDDLYAFNQELARVGFGVLPPGSLPSSSAYDY